MRKVIFTPDEYYHIYNRGVDKRIVFENNGNRHRFLKLLYLCNGQNSFHFQDLDFGDEFNFKRGKPLVEIISYCLMSNHFHLLLKEKEEKGISAFMHKLGLAYTKYFNKTNDRSGALFETNFSAKHLNNDEYLKYTFAYIHLNPIKMIDKNWKKEGIKDLGKSKDFLNRYQFSSYLDYLGSTRKENCIVSKNSLPEYFENKKEIEEYIKDWLTYSYSEDLVNRN